MAQTDYSAFRTLSLNYVRVDGSTPYSTVDNSGNTDFLAIANEVLPRFTEETLCLFSDSIAFTVPTSTDTINMRDTTVLAQAVIDIQRVYINKNPIYQTSEEDISRSFPTYLSDPAAQPSYWFSMPPEQFVLYPKSDQAYANSFVSGWYVHPPITAESGAGGTILIRPEDIRCAAKECALAMLEPYALGESRERYNLLMAENTAEKAKIKGRASVLFQGPATRRGPQYVYNLT